MPQTVHSLLSLFSYSSCPWKSTPAMVASTFWAVLTILKEPLLLLCLLLVAKGWCITRGSLERKEIAIAAVSVAALYAAVSVQLSLGSVISLVPMVSHLKLPEATARPHAARSDRSCGSSRTCRC